MTTMLKAGRKIAGGLRVTPDAELPTPEAIEFRIELLRREKPTKTVAKRIEALKARLPGYTPPVRVDSSLLASKSQVDDFVPTRTIKEDIGSRKDDLYRNFDK